MVGLTTAESWDDTAIYCSKQSIVSDTIYMTPCFYQYDDKAFEISRTHETLV